MNPKVVVPIHAFVHHENAGLDDCISSLTWRKENSDINGTITP